MSDRFRAAGASRCFMHSRKKPNYHTRQLCRQIEQALELAILCDCEDPILSGLELLEVRPLGRASMLEAVIGVPTTDLDQLAVIRTRLQQSEGRLRTAISQEIHRKRTPHLRFLLIPQPE